MSGLVLASVGGSFSNTVNHGSLILALPVAAIAGLVSFASPCVLPLVPGYLSYVTGVSGVDLAEGEQGARRRSRMLLGSALFVLGFSAVFVLEGQLFGAVTLGWSGNVALTRVLGGVTVVLGLAFLGYLPFFSREARIHRLPRAGVVGAPLLGFVFGLGWTPCLGPTLSAVMILSYGDQAGQLRSAILVTAYCLGLGIPFIAVGLGFERALGAMAFMRRHSQAVMRFGGALLILVGVMLLTGWWASLVSIMQHHFPQSVLV